MISLSLSLFFFLNLVEEAHKTKFIGSILYALWQHTKTACISAARLSVSNLILGLEGF